MDVMRNDVMCNRSDENHREMISGDRVASIIHRFFYTTLGAVFLGTLTNLSPPAIAGTIVPEPEIPGYVHEVYTLEDGLPKAGINEVVRTRDGFLWVATFDGLARFDGVRFEIFNSERVPALASNRITRLLEDRSGRLWIGTEQHHLIRYTDSVFTACVETTPDRIECAAPTSGPGPFGGILEAPDGTLWAAGLLGIRVFEDGAFLHEPSITSDSAIKNHFIDRSGKIWIGTRTEGWRGTRGRFERLDLDPEAIITSFAEDLYGNIWIGTLQGIGRFEDGRVRMELPNGVVTHDAQGTLWAAVGKRLLRSRGEGFEVVVESDHAGLELNSVKTASAGKESWVSWGPHLLRGGSLVPGFVGDHDHITSLTRDDQGTLWVPTSRGELHAFHPERVTTITAGLEFENISPIYEDRDGTLWVGEGSNLAALTPGAKRFHTFPGPIARAHGLPSGVYAMLRDRRGQFWIGSQGLFAFDGKIYTGPLGPVKNKFPVRALLEGQDGVLWVGADNRLYRFDPALDAPWSEYGIEDGLPDYKVRVLCETPEGLWLGTNGGGVVLFRMEEKEPITHIDTRRGLSSDLVRAIWPAPSGHLWIATENRGLNRLDPATIDAPGGPLIKEVSERHGLYSSGVHRMVDDGLGNLWMSSNHGIFRVRLADLEAVADGRLDKLESIVYTERDGMRDREANGGVDQAGLRDRQGRIWFPTMRGVVRLDPRELQETRAPPPVSIIALRSNGKDLDLLTSTRLTPTQRSFEIDFSAPSFRAPERLRFRYRLVPYDSTWVESGTRRTAFYTQVPPGRYTFEVAVIEDGVWSEAPARREIEVIARFFETRSFALLCALLLGCAVAGGIRLREARARARELRLEQLVDERTATIAEQAERLRELDRLKSQLFANVSHELRTPLTLLLGPLRDAREGAFGTMGDALKKQLGLAENNAGRLLTLVDQLLETARLDAGRVSLNLRRDDPAAFLRRRVESFLLLAERRGITLQSRLPEEPVTLSFDTDALTKVVDNLLVNALDFAPPGGHVEVMLDLPMPKTVRLCVSDDGPGIPTDQLELVFERFHQVEGAREAAHDRRGTGLGLALARRLVELHGGTLRAEERTPHGVIFTALLPISATEPIPSAEAEIESTARIPDTRVPRAPVVAVTSKVTPNTTPDAAPAGAPDVAPIHPRPQGPEEQALILIVDDHAEIRAYLRRHLEPAYRVCEAADGREALRRARDERPDLVVSDIMMPELDGNAFFRALRADNELDMVPVVLVTAKASPESRLEALDEGVDDYLVKPFDPRELRARIDNLIAGRHRLRERLAEVPRGLVVSEIEAAPADQAFLERVHRIIEARLGDYDLSVAELAATLGCDRTYLLRKLRELVDESPSGLIRSMRLQRGEQLLVAKAGTVSEIAYQVGFKTVSHFSNAFLERYGERPKAYAARRTS